MPKPKKNISDSNRDLPIDSRKTNGLNKKNSKKDKETDIKIKKEKSSLSEFIKRNLPSDEEVKQFDDFAEGEVRGEEIEDGLSEIYQDERGEMVNVQELEIKKKRGFIFRFFSFLFIAALFAGIGYGAYNLYFQQTTDNKAVELNIFGKENVFAGEEFYYEVEYKNLSGVPLNKIEIKLAYPENFIFLESDPAPSQGNDFWQFGFLESHRSGKIRIKGKLFGEKDKDNILSGSMIYIPANFSSEFRKDGTFRNKITETGIDILVDYEAGVLINEENKIIVRYKAKDENYLNNFRISIEQPENMEFIRSKEESVMLGTWNISEVSKEEKDQEISFKVKEKIDSRQELILKFECDAGGQKYFIIKEEKIVFEVIKNDLNLNLIINGMRSDQGVNLGETLNYSIVYNNKGEAEMKDVVIMAVMQGDLLDWKSLKDKNKGKVGDNSIIWTKEEIEGLGLIKTDEEGTINFSINLKQINEINVDKQSIFEIKNYAQFSIENIEKKNSEDMKSNTIVNKINSDLNLDEQVRYFSADNIPVGSGPLPPKVGNKTSYKVFWVLTNNLHELNNVKLSVKLPDYIKWDEKNRSTVGTVQYDPGEHKVMWDIGRLPISVYKAEAEWSISLTPTENDVDKIVVLVSGTTVDAMDSATGFMISKTTKAKTTKLEDDDVAETDGRIVE